MDGKDSEDGRDEVMVPYYRDENTTLFLGDCREVLPTLGNADAALVTDPPYGIAHSSNHGASWQGTEIANDRDTACRDFAIAWATGLPAAIFGSWKVQRPTGTRAVLIWDKGPAFGMGDLSFPWKTSWEEIYILGDGWRGRRDEGVLKGHIVVSWESKGRTHPHEKPVSLCCHLIQKTVSSTIVDPFAGSGSTLVAAKLCGRKSIGIEIEEKYAEIAADRLRQGVLFGAA